MWRIGSTAHMKRRWLSQTVKRSQTPLRRRCDEIRNFEILRGKWPELAALGGFAEAYAHADPASALVKLRLFAENLTKDIYRDLGLPKPDQPAFVDLLTTNHFPRSRQRSCWTSSTRFASTATKPRMASLRQRAMRSGCCRRHSISRVGCLFNSGREMPKASLLSSNPRRMVPKTARGKLKREKRQVLEKLAAQEAQMEALLRELEVARQTAATAEKKAEEIQALASSGAAAANLLEFNEATTRARIIDSLLAAAGWNVALGETSTTEVGKEIEVQHQPTTSGIGYADYVLWDDNGNPLAVIEAKKTSVDPERGRQQAKLYADGLEKMHGHRPVIFYTNGYDIWMWDDAQGYPPRKLFGYYSKDSLQYLANFQRAGRKPLNSLEPNVAIVDRLYQIEAIKRVSERFSNNHRKALIVQATGTGKTRVAIALADLLIRAGWVKRVLFLCDRRELRKQAKNAFGDFLSEPIRIVSSRVNSTATERIFLATYPAMQKVLSVVRCRILRSHHRRRVAPQHLQRLRRHVSLFRLPPDRPDRNARRFCDAQHLRPVRLRRAAADREL